VSWTAPAVGNDQLVVINGATAASTRDAGRIIATDATQAAGADYAVFYTQDFTATHAVTVTSTAQTDTSNPPVITGYNLDVQAALSAAEAANINGALHLAWRAAGSGTGFANDVIVPSSGTNSYDTVLANLAAGQYDLKLYYTDAQGRQVIVEWQRVDTATATTTFNGLSQTVLAQENGGSIATDAQGTLSVTPGVYTGALDVGALSASLALNLQATGNSGGSLQTDGRATGYFAETQYDALNHKIASNENDGLWRTFGVDGNGNTVQINLLGDRSSAGYDPAHPIITYTAFDARNRKVADFGAPITASGTSGLARAVNRYVYNVLDKVTAHTDALGNTSHAEFNALGTQTASIDPFGARSETRLDQFGDVTAQVTQLGHISSKFYDLQGNLLSERDALGNTTTYTYDAFGRRLTQSDALGNTTTYSYDQRDRLVQQTDPMGNRASFSYDGRNNRTSSVYPLGQETDQVFDGLGRVIDTEVYLNGSPNHNRRAYDAYGNLISETDAMGRVKTHVYGAFGRLLQDIDEDGNVVAYGYDADGRRISDTDPNGPKHIQRSYDAAGEVLSIQDSATGVSSTYTYDLAGHRATEAITTPGNAHNRNISYQYDALGQLVRWADSVTGDNLNTLFDAEGNRVRAYTDSGYDPLGQNTAANPNFRTVDHVYSYDADRRLTQEVQRTTDASNGISDAIINGYTYDAASNRVTWNNAGVTVTYTYDADGRVKEGDFNSGSDTNQQLWSYDGMGNVLTYTTTKNGSQVSRTVSTYNDANRLLTSNKDGEVTTQHYDLTQRITQTVLQNKGKTYTYTHSYFGDGREKSVSAVGDANGNSVSTYDADKVRSRVDLGQGDGLTRPEYKTFVSDNEGHILYAFHDDGKSAAPETHEYLYANTNPVGENAVGVDGKKSIVLDAGSYALNQNLSDSIPGANLSYTVKAGDTLQGIASQMYGNPSLWFVIAEANGLSAGETLKAGTQLIIPNSIQSGTITADNHKVYSEGEIVGSTLPNLKSPPPPSNGGCGSILAIIIIVVIAVVVAWATAGLGDVLVANLGIATGATASAGSVAAAVAVYAVAGAVVAAVGSIVQQGLFVALGYQEKFSWKQVAGAAVSGLFTGAASGVGAALKAGSIVASSSIQFAKVATSALDVVGAASQQLIDNGKITSWTSLAAAGVNGYAQAGQAAAKATNAATDVVNAAKATSAFAAATNYVTPWAQLAETAIRNNGQLTPGDWAGAVGATLAQAVDDQHGAG
jgi:YD repeat-containing protein